MAKNDFFSDFIDKATESMRCHAALSQYVNYYL